MYLCEIFIMWSCQQKVQLVDAGDALKDLGLAEHQLRFTSTVSFDDEGQVSDTADKIYQIVKRYLNK